TASFESANKADIFIWLTIIPSSVPSYKGSYPHYQHAVTIGNSACCRDIGRPMPEPVAHDCSRNHRRCRGRNPATRSRDAPGTSAEVRGQELETQRGR